MMRTVKETIRRYAMLPAGARVLCGLSGGADSVALTLCLRELGYDVCACHLHHGLRGADADADAAFCAQLCTQQNIACIVERCDALAEAKRTGQSFETAARTLRYDFFERCARTLHADFIATAHNADDNLETMLFHLIRGTGPAGLAGIPPVRENIVRPLIAVQRREIEDYLRARGQQWRTDATNLDDGCTRNRIRHHVIPALRDIEPRAAVHAAHTAALLRQDNACLEAQADGCDTRIETLRTLPMAVRARAVRRLLKAADTPMGEVTAAHIEQVCALTEKASGTVSLPGHRIAVRRGAALCVEHAPSQPQEIEIDWETPVRFGAYTLQIVRKISDIHSSFKQYPICYATIRKSKLTVRTWRPSDRMTLPGARGARTLKRLYRERGIAPPVRDTLPVLCADDVIVAAAGIGTDFRFAGNDSMFEIFTDR